MDIVPDDRDSDGYRVSYYFSETAGYTIDVRVDCRGGARTLRATTLRKKFLVFATIIT